MNNLYERLETNANNNDTTTKVDLLFDLKKDKYCLEDTESVKKIICITGSCDLKLKKDDLIETITLNHPSETIKIDKNVSVEISNYTEQTKISVEYLETQEEFWGNEEVKNPKVSIIIPAFNVQDYIEECLGSLVRQTLREIEIIIVDDGSFDLTPSIINMFKGDKRIRVYTQGNSGLSFTRNKGINLARGEYIAFVDADDWIDTDFIEKLYNAAKNSNSDIAAATIIRKRKTSQKYRVHYTEEKIYKTLEEKILICDIPKCCYVWNKIYKSDFIKNFKFKVGAFFEDVLWTPEVLKQANQLITVPDTNYYYRVNNNSIVKKLPSKKKQEDSYNSKKYIVKFFDENNLYLSPKGRNLTKRIYYFLKIPVLKIKEFENVETFLLFGFLPVGRKKVGL